MKASWHKGFRFPNRVIKTFAYGNSAGGPVIRANTGDTLEVRLRNDMDGVPALPMPPVQPGEEFVYSFKVPGRGTYWYHPHVGAQLDTGLYGPLIVDDPNESDEHDVEVLMLDDWTDGCAGVRQRSWTTSAATAWDPWAEWAGHLKSHWVLTPGMSLPGSPHQRTSPG